jgi:phosphate transport system protein
MALHLQKEIMKLKKKILSLGTIVEESVRKAVDSLENRDDKLAQQVIDNDYDIDQQEVDLEEECLKILALYQPVANDLRFVIAVLKINNDLERIGDLAGGIAERAKRLAYSDKISFPFDFHKMAERVQLMLRNSLDALVGSDLQLANDVCRSDDEIDAMNREVYGKVHAGIRSDLAHLEIYIQYIGISRALERIADHTTNIAEDVVYMINGAIIRHTEYQNKG